LKNVKDSFFRSEDKLLVGFGVKDLIAIDTFDATFISKKELSQEVKELVIEMKNSGITEASQNKKGFRPWGSYLSIAKDKSWQVKILEVSVGASLSLQKHHHRAEHWVVVQGTALVKVGEKENILHENQSTYIPLGVKHQLSNPGKSILRIIEVQSGDYLGEDDIVRYKDQYGR
jgi:mannose-1-phosphate guanylyltransferase